MRALALLLITLTGCAARGHHPALTPVVFKGCKVVQSSSAPVECRCVSAVWMRDAKTKGWVAECQDR